MFQIGMFARLGQVSVRTLRFYDERGLIKPARIDAQTGYRYYNADQIPRLLQILALRELGFALDEIADALRAPLSPDAFALLLDRKREELRERMGRDQDILARIEARLTQWRKEQIEIMNPLYEVATKSVPQLLAAAIYETIPSWEEVTPTFNRIFDEVFTYVHANAATITAPPFDLWFAEEGQNADMQVAACLPIAKPIPETERVKMLTLPEVPVMAFTIHRGGFEGLEEAHRSIARWAESNGYKIIGPNREIYHVYERDGDPSLWVTEEQYPVERI